ncbi:MAG: ABC transporter permease [Thermorudis peleae]|nr:ABC transporter permease [Thermorudis peleae]
MIAYIVRRVLMAIPVMLLVAVTTFLLLHMTPGDPVAVLLGPDATTDQIAAMRRQLGLTDPLYLQLYHWFARLLHGDLGQSIFLQKPVTAAIAERLAPTLELSLLALVVAIVIGIPAGVLAAVRQGRLLDVGVMLVAMVGISMPTFWLGLNLIFLFAVTLRWLPAQGYVPLSQGVWENLSRLILPALTLGAGQGAFLARMTRSVMLEVLNEDFVRTARAKGLIERRVLLGHALRAGLVPIVTVIGITFALLMGGAVVTEQVFNLPGVGRLLVQAVLRRDFPLIQGIVLVIALTYVLINLGVDLLYALLDPRIRYS